MEGQLIAQGWAPTSFDTYRSAVIDDGKQTLSIVTEHLYKGGNRTPDVYFISKYGEERYKNTFNTAQRATLENGSRHFNIRTAVKKYDISLNYILQEHVCGLAPKGARNWQMQGTFENMLNKVSTRRNKVSHNSWSMDEYKLKEELTKLQELYGDIIDYVDSITYCSIDYDRSIIINSLREKFPDEDYGNQTMNTCISNVQANSFGSSSMYGERSNSGSVYRQANKGGFWQTHRPEEVKKVLKQCEEEDDSDRQTLGKVTAVTLGVAGVAAAAWGVAKLLENNKSSEEEKRRKRRSNNEEECSIM